MPSIKDALSSATTGDIKAPARFPAGNYVAVIVEPELLPFYWPKRGTYGLAYTPRFRCVRSIEVEDDSNPELAEEQQTKLDEFGDWTNREFQFAFNNQNYTPPRRTAIISDVNFPLIETDSDGNFVSFMENMLWRFYMKEGDAEQGFVHDVLGLSYEKDTPLDEVIEDTKGRQFQVQLEYEPRQNDPNRTDLVVRAALPVADD